jgi:hypothetical protein
LVLGKCHAIEQVSCLCASCPRLNAFNFCSSVVNTITQWVQEYGPVVSVRQGNQVSVIIGNLEVRGHLLHSVLHKAGRPPLGSQ